MAKDSDQALRGASIYQVFIRNYSPEGTFDAALPALERAQRLGFDFIYLAPIHPIGKAARKGSLGSPYAIADYRAVDPDLGGEAGFRRFLEAAHGLGLRVLMDIVFNHTSPDSVLALAHPDWFWRDKAGRPRPRVAEWSDVVDLDHGNPGLRAYLLETIEHWVGLGVDGFRCDVASLVPVEFWIEARRRGKLAREAAGRAAERGAGKAAGRASRGSGGNGPEPLVWLAESVHRDFVDAMRDMGYEAACDAELHEAFDLSYDYDGRGELEAAWAGRGPLSDYLRHLGLQRSMLPSHAIKARFLENHDQPRAASRFSGARLRNWTLFAMLLDGAFLAYMGEELALARRPDLFDKDPVDWSAGDPAFESWFAKAQPLAKGIRGRERRFSCRELAAGVVLVERSGGRAPVRALLNLDGRSGFIDLDPPLGGRELLSGHDIPPAARIELGEEPLLFGEGEDGLSRAR